MDKIRLLIVEDSAFLRNSYLRLLSDVDFIDVIDTAKNGKEGVEKALELNPDVITMDIEMPVMNGLDAVKEIMEKHPTPILMISSLTNEGAEATLEALNRGAVDFIKKETAFSKVSEMKSEMVEKIKTIGANNTLKNRILRKSNLNKESRHSSSNSSLEARQTPHFLTQRPDPPEKKDDLSRNISERKIPFRTKIQAISIGISTGGPISLQKVIPLLSARITVPVFIVQHMPANFTKSLAERLNAASKLNVKEAENGELIRGGNVYLAPGGNQMLISHSKIVITDKKPENELYSPSFNLALGSQIHNYHEKMIAVVMTGMGSDGTTAMKKLHEIGGYNVAQDPATCVVAGMPNSALKAGIINQIVPLDGIAAFINKIF